MPRPALFGFVAAGVTATLVSLSAEKITGVVTEQPPAREQAHPVNLYPGFAGYSRPVTTSSTEAQLWFNQGIQLLYGFNHDEAIRSFEQAAKIDPSCAMAWWGSAYARGLHINNPMMGEEQSRLANLAAGKAVAALDNESAIERALVNAVRQRYAWPVPEDRLPLDQAYADAMESVWHRFPKDADVGALFAESLMNLQPWDLWTGDAVPKGRTLEIVAVLERTMAITPHHPGANHFYIHAIEASPWPQKGTGAAERLKDLVPGSGHLVHMPSHIYIRTGRYADAADANERAIAADEAYFEDAPEPEFYSIYFMHNIHFLAYAAMMEGRYETAINAARKIAGTMPREFLRENAVIADGFMPTALHVMIRFGKWSDILAERKPEEWQLFSRAERHFARSLANSALGNTDAAKQEIDLLNEVSAELTDEWLMGNNSAIDVIAIARMMAEGELAYREGRSDRAFELLRKAVKLEENLSYDEPPGWMQPVRHALGALLLADGRHSEAADVYREDLTQHPNNAWSLLGLQQALERSGKVDESVAMAPQVQKAWARADVKPVASCYCHPDARTDER
ncbi:tetratricopeptide repeat protein [Fuerstiella marisgermanici]|uniref:Putative O-linked N-acetylglucosamine transferase, SPINDLY family n=1 Tax=Fuerstiella marisgermanici TaxID=1891926 RepID=A0A1P8WRE3_9PLAN|nr:tetratricopeptide repeat protein [Fuerstiella marisgermanici]APZ96598.1 putative O-linked N-acetylglucosamine transferase, SPINDLY family [Fuerstiella marisgermanici]